MPWKDPNAWRQHRDPKKHAEAQRRYSKGHPEYEASAKRRLRAACNAALGNECCQCGFNDPRALEIDHIHNDGGLERRGNRRWQMLSDIIKNGAQEKYQLLCSNCHSIKTYEEVWSKPKRKGGK